MSNLDCKIIELPDNAYGWEGHKWGLEAMHYEDKIYLDLLNQLINITKK